MNHPIDLVPAYRLALQGHLRRGQRGGREQARDLGRQALAAGLQTLDLAKLHERILVLDLLPACPARKRPALIRRAASFFAIVMDPIEREHRNEREVIARLGRSVKDLGLRTVELAASNQELSQEIAQRKAGEEALRTSERRYVHLLKQSDLQQTHLRLLSRQILSAQEDERKVISRELHDVIAQTLTGINIQLTALKHTADLSAKDLDRTIGRTQRLVVKSVDIVHKFARELRPAVLDDLGLIPALHTFLKTIAKRTGLLARLTAVAEVETLDIARRTVLFRVAQEALNNVTRHARAAHVTVIISRIDDGISMRIHDDGRSFAVEQAIAPRGRKRLGLLGMRERMEMVGGTFAIASAPGQGTTVIAVIPLKDRQPRSVAKSPATLKK
jgi:signal transduction histidine kinase